MDDKSGSNAGDEEEIADGEGIQRHSEQSRGEEGAGIYRDGSRHRHHRYGHVEGEQKDENEEDQVDYQGDTEIPGRLAIPPFKTRTQEGRRGSGG